MAKANAAYKLEKAIKKLQAAIAEIEELHYEGLWTDQIITLKAAVLAIEDRLATDNSISSLMANYNTKKEPLLP